MHPAAAASAAAWPPAFSATQSLPQGPGSLALPSAQPASIPLARNVQQAAHSAISTGMTAQTGNRNDRPDLQLAPSAWQQQEGFTAAASQNPPAESSIARTSTAHQATSRPEASASRHRPENSINSAQPASQGFTNASRGQQQQQQQFERCEAFDAGPGRSNHLQSSSANRGRVDLSLQMHMGRQVSPSPA